MTEVFSDGFPHLEIPGSKVATHLPEAYRRYTASFIAISCQGIHRAPLIRRNWPFKRPISSEHSTKLNARFAPDLGRGTGFLFSVVVFFYQYSVLSPLETKKPLSKRLYRYVEKSLVRSRFYVSSLSSMPILYKRRAESVNPHKIQEDN